MVSQILVHTISNVEKLGEYSVRALQVIDRGQNGDRIGPLAEILQGVRSLTDRSAVHQSNVDQGAIELF
jgi:hypothetical protein